MASAPQRLYLALLLMAWGGASTAAREAPFSEPGGAWTPEISVEMRYFPLSFERPRHWPNTSELGEGAGIQFSPDGRFFMFMEYRGDLSADAGVAKVHIYESAAVRRALRAGKRTVAPMRAFERRSRSSFVAAMSDVRWDQDGAAIIFQGVDDNDVRAIYRYLVSNGELRVIARWPVTPPTMLTFDSRGDTSVVYAMTRPESRQDDQYPADWMLRAADGVPQLGAWQAPQRAPVSVLSARAQCAGRESPVPPGATGVRAIAISPTACRAMLIRQAGADGKEWVYDLLDIATGHATRIASAVHGNDSISWSPDGRWVLLSDVHGPGVSRPASIALLEAATGRLIQVPGVAAIANARKTVHWHSASELIIPERGSSGGAMLSLRGGGWERSAAPLPAAAPHDGLTIEITQDFNTPAKVVARLGSREIILSSVDPVLAGIRRERWHEIAWTGADGQTRRAALMMPTRRLSRPPPVVVNPYWYERFEGSHSRLFLPDGLHDGAESAAQALAARGIATLWMDGWDSADVSTSPNEGAAFVERLDGAIAELVRQRLIDPARIGMAGFSRGGFLTLYSATHPGRFPVQTHIGIDNTTGGAAEALLDAATGLPNQGLGNFATDRAGWDARDTLMNAARVRGPVLFTLNFNGKSDRPMGRRADYDVTHLTLFGAFRLARRPFDFVSFPDGEHMLIRPRERLILMKTIVDWMAFWLKDEIPADPDRARAWMQMRDEWRHQQAWEAAGNPVGSMPPPDFQAPPAPAAVITAP